MANAALASEENTARLVAIVLGGDEAIGICLVGSPQLGVRSCLARTVVVRAAEIHAGLSGEHVALGSEQRDGPLHNVPTELVLVPV